MGLDFLDGSELTDEDRWNRIERVLVMNPEVFVQNAGIWTLKESITNSSYTIDETGSLRGKTLCETEPSLHSRFNISDGRTSNSDLASFKTLEDVESDKTASVSSAHSVTDAPEDDPLCLDEDKSSNGKTQSIPFLLEEVPMSLDFVIESIFGNSTRRHMLNLPKSRE